jgi:hypothetical protein
LAGTTDSKRGLEKDGFGKAQAMNKAVTNTAVSNRRRSRRVFLRVRVVARFRLLERDCLLEGDTVTVNAHGGMVQLAVAPLKAGDMMTLTNPETDQAESCRVVRIEATPDHGFQVGFAFERPSPKFWAVAFPPTDWFEALIDDE